MISQKTTLSNVWCRPRGLHVELEVQIPNSFVRRYDVLIPWAQLYEIRVDEALRRWSNSEPIPLGEPLF